MRPRFDPGSVHIRFVVDEVALGEVFLAVRRFSPIVTPPVLFNRLHLNPALSEEQAGKVPSSYRAGLPLSGRIRLRLR